MSVNLTKAKLKTWTKHKPKARGTALILRTNEEAWALALENKSMVYNRLYKYVNSKSLNWYKGSDLRAELESYAWEGMLEACKRWDPALGKLTTYAIPTIDNYLHRGMQVLARMGGNFKTGGSIKGANPKMTMPWVDSLEQYLSDRYEVDSERTLADTTPQPWQDSENSFEESFIESESDKSTVQRIREIVSQMPQPHRQVFELVHFSEPTHEKMDTALGEGLTLREVSKIVGKDTTIVRKWLLEAEEYIRYQLEQEI